jgi:hypothetical protein
LTVKINNEAQEIKVKKFLDDLGLEYSSEYANWWENLDLIKELDMRSKNLKSGKDTGVSLKAIKQKLSEK